MVAYLEHVLGITYNHPEGSPEACYYSWPTIALRQMHIANFSRFQAKKWVCIKDHGDSGLRRVTTAHLLSFSQHPAAGCPCPRDGWVEEQRLCAIPWGSNEEVPEVTHPPAELSLRTLKACVARMVG